MAEAHVQIDSNLAEVLKNFEALPATLQKALAGGLRLGLAVIKGAMQRNITNQFRSTSARGLRNSIFISVNELTGTIEVDKQYAKVHEFGTVGKGGRLPDIVPVRAKALRFTIHTANRIARISGGVYRRLAKPQAVRQVIFCRRVSIPARPFFFPALNANLDEIPEQMRGQVDAALSKVGGQDNGSR